MNYKFLLNQLDEEGIIIKSKQMKTSKQFIQNKSDSDLASSSSLVSSSTISNNSDSDFLSE